VVVSVFEDVFSDCDCVPLSAQAVRSTAEAHIASMMFPAFFIVSAPYLFTVVIIFLLKQV